MTAHRQLGRALLVALSMAALAVACGDDTETTGTTASGGATSSAGGDGGGGAGESSTTSGAGGEPNVICDHDNRCDPDVEECACPDCWNFDKCNNGGCMDDGECTEKEQCYCADCASEPACDGYCISCRNFTNFFSSQDALCTDGSPSSADLWSDLEGCVCDGVCATECSTNLCSGLSPSQACLDCMDESCATERDACMADVRPHVLCNPLTLEGCSLNNAVCDVRLRSTNLVFPPTEVPVGFECFVRTTDTMLCGACDTSSGTEYCGQGQGCVDGTGAPVEAGTCGKYCCDDADCGGATCQKGGFESIAPGLGTCDQSGTGGAGGAGGSGTPGCDESSNTPSMGSCVTPTQ